MRIDARALADWMDARAAIVHEWRENGASVQEIVKRLTPDEGTVTAWLAAPPVPFPGSSRARVVELSRRVADLERTVHRPTTPVPNRPAPTESEYRSLRLHPDPECCGCRFWDEPPPPSGEHHPRCEHVERKDEGR
jgi:hypothetical protein